MSQLARDPTLATLPVEMDWFVTVVRDAQAGNIAAFDTLFRLYNARICTYLARMVGNDEEGRDLAQETFIKVWRALPSMHDELHFDTWLFRIATKYCYRLFAAPEDPLAALERTGRGEYA
jgi:RNA polymerase sigma-70 factor (ECF subfamily)